MFNIMTKWMFKYKLFKNKFNGFNKKKKISTTETLY